MLLQTNSYIVPKDKRGDHSRLLRRFRQTLTRLGCTHFECYEQVGANWTNGETTGRFVQIMRFRDRKHQLSVQAAERNDAVAQQVISEFCELINFPYQQQQGLFAVGFYTSTLPITPPRLGSDVPASGAQPALTDGEEVPAEENVIADETGDDEPITEDMLEAESETEAAGDIDKVVDDDDQVGMEDLDEPFTVSPLESGPKPTQPESQNEAFSQD